MEQIKIFEKGFNYSQDGPGNRLVYHLQGCNMHCPWCANPDGIGLEGSLVTDAKHLLDSICPYGAVNNSTLNRTYCKDCNTRECIDSGTKGLRLSYTQHTVEELVAEAVSSQSAFFGGGGVTFTGGEPTVQFQVLKQALAGLKAAGINTAIENNGTHPRLPELLPYIDVMIMDFKHWDNHTLKRVTGVGLDNIKKNISYILNNGGRLSLRIPLIDGFNSSLEDLKGFIAYFDTLDKAMFTLELLPFHEYGQDKWATVGLDYTMKGGRITQKTLDKFTTDFKASGINVVNT